MRRIDLRCLRDRGNRRGMKVMSNGNRFGLIFKKIKISTKLNLMVSIGTADRRNIGHLNYRICMINKLINMICLI